MKNYILSNYLINKGKEKNKNPEKKGFVKKGDNHWYGV